MIERYSRTPMRKIWEPENKFQRWLDVELAACFVHMNLGNIPKDDYETIIEKAKFDVKRINEIEAEVNHDVIAFLTSVAEFIGPASRFVHLGLTSSDVVDTAFSLLIQDAGKLLLADIDTFMSSLKTQAIAHKHTLTMGRTHGVHAEPTTFGLKIAVWYEEMKRNKARLIEALGHVNVGKISGAVGNYAHMPPDVEEAVCSRLGLECAKASTQILQRDRHAHFMTTLAIIGGTLEKIATEIRALQKTEFNEVIEPFSAKQKGSSAMPHKRNPILCERVTGLARVLRGFSMTALENQNLWHERDISHSSTERVIFPDATTLLDYMFSLMTKVIDGMTVNADQMMENIGRSYNVFFSQQLLLRLIEKGMTREDAYRLVQKNAIDCFVNRELFNDRILNESEILNHLSKDELNTIFSFDKYIAHVDTIFERVFTA
ncbi:MAG: adenylosuccinate lyase [Candidatus Margulisiibacteriota bacterium]